VQRQVWIYLTDDDEKELLARLSEKAPLRRLQGRFFKGTESELRANPDALETKQLTSAERWTYLFHPAASEKLVVHTEDDGPFAGWSRVDEVRSEVLVLVRVSPDAQGLAPSRLQANTHAWFGGVKTRKSSDFSLWISDAMRIAESFPATAFDWIHAAPGAIDWARNGGRLHYLYKPVGLEPASGTMRLHRPHGSNAED